MLDTLIHRDTDGSLYTTVYRKPTHTDQYLAADSDHPLQHKLGVVKTLFKRAKEVSSKSEDEQQEKRHIRKALRNCGYKDWQFRLAERPPINRVDKPEFSGSCVIPYVRGTSEALKRVFEKAGVRTYFKPTNTLRQSLVSPKDPLEKNEKTGAVYHISCKECPAAYVGETGRALGTRLAEHRQPSRITSAVVCHTLDTGHSFDLENAKILDSEPRYFERGVREAIQIAMHRPNLNRDTGRTNLPRVYHHLLRNGLVQPRASASGRE